MHIFVKTLLLAVCLTASPAMAETLSINDILALNEAKVGDEVILAKIQSSGSHFDLPTVQMIDLRKRGISSAVLAAMISTAKPSGAADISVDSPDPSVPHASGLYAVNSEPTPGKMVRMDPTSSSQMKTGGILGYALTGGIASMSVKVSIPGAGSRIRVGKNPTFFFFFDESRPGSNSPSFLGAALLPSSPSEFNLVRLDRKSDRREAKVGKVNIGGAKMGVMDGDRLQISYQILRAGVYKVSINRALDLGEYGFLYSVAGAATSGAAGSRIFDFGVD